MRHTTNFTERSVGYLDIQEMHNKPCYPSVSGRSLELATSLLRGENLLVGTKLAGQDKQDSKFNSYVFGNSIDNGKTINIVGNSLRYFYNYTKL
jgi:hypothetical protein